MEFGLLWAALTAAALAWLGLRVWNRRLPDRPFDVVLGGAIAGLAAGRLTSMISQGTNPLANPVDVIVIRGGVHTGVATIVFLATAWWVTRTDRSALDAVAPAMLLALAGWHAGCLWRSACLGTPSDLPWSWALGDSAVTRHPVEIYAAIGLGLGAWAVSRLGWRLWSRAGSALAISAAVRLSTEPLRPSLTGGPLEWYVAGLVLGIAAMVLGWWWSGEESTAPT